MGDVDCQGAHVSDLYEEHRRLMFSIAYRMLGSASDAEDIVQEAFLRLHRESDKATKIESPKAYLSAVTTRLSIDHLRSARVRRERYVGTWLPEPLVTEEQDVEQHAVTADSLSMAFLVLLESLSPRTIGSVSSAERVASGSLGWALAVLGEQGMPPQEIRVLTTTDGLVMHRYVELHLERLEEWLAAQRHRLHAAEQVLTTSVERVSPRPE
jgi:RNA polymerase sigma factor (sigma-70 family)